jgi:hypothetical protein
MPCRRQMQVHDKSGAMHDAADRQCTSKNPGCRASALGPSTVKWRKQSCRYTVQASGTCRLTKLAVMLYSALRST